MNTKSIVLGIFSSCLIAGTAFGQETPVVEISPAPKEEVKTVKKEIRKEIRMEDNDGVKTLTIITDDNGVISEEVFVGAEADAKLAELAPQMEDVTMEQEREEERIEVEVDDDGNVKSLTITKSRNGEETVEVFEGEDAKKKLDEINSHQEIEIEVDEKSKKPTKKRTHSKEKEVERID